MCFCVNICLWIYASLYNWHACVLCVDVYVKCNCVCIYVYTLCACRNVSAYLADVNNVCICVHVSVHNVCGLYLPVSVPVEGSQHIRNSLGLAPTWPCTGNLNKALLLGL